MVEIVLVEHDPTWVDQFEAVAQRIASALGFVVDSIEHVGSTSVPGLAAKPIIDVLLLVPDSTDEPAYVPHLKAMGFTFHLREPDWYQHRLLKGVDPAVNLHVFTVDCPEAEAMVAFRDHLRASTADRDRYEIVKRELADLDWDNVQDYADAKTEVIRDIQSRITGS
jgi:GrpB-like predicted nucleotidyltransferase (UPF0157 family)